MKKYTVLLLYPEYVADEYGKETYLAWVNAGSPEQAVGEAQRMAWIDNNQGEDDCLHPDDFFPLITIQGHHGDLTPESWR